MSKNTRRSCALSTSFQIEGNRVPSSIENIWTHLVSRSCDSFQNINDTLNVESNEAFTEKIRLLKEKKEKIMWIWWNSNCVQRQIIITNKITQWITYARKLCNRWPSLPWAQAQSLAPRSSPHSPFRILLASVACAWFPHIMMSCRASHLFIRIHGFCIT